ncbi:MAG: Piwi domain-containing protein [Promethearchaeota archaeon]
MEQTDIFNFTDTKPILLLNGRIIEQESFEVYIYPIQGFLKLDSINRNILLNRLKYKYKFPLAPLKLNPKDASKWYVISYEKFQPKKNCFTFKGKKIVIDSSSHNKITLSNNNSEHIQALTDLITAVANIGFYKNGFKLPQNVRRNNPQFAKGISVNFDRIQHSNDYKDYTYFVFEGFKADTLYLNDYNKFVLCIDPKAHLIKCITPDDNRIEEAVLQAGKSIASSKIPKIIRNEFKRKTMPLPRERKNRTNALFHLLNDVPFKISDKLIRINDYKTLKEPVFEFGDNQKAFLNRMDNLEEFLLKNIKKYGPFESVDKEIIIQPLILDILKPYLDKYLKSFTLLKNKFDSILRCEVSFNDPIILTANPKDIEIVLEGLHDDLEKNIDICIGLSKGLEKTTIFWSPIKKGLQNIPSQIIRNSTFNSPKIFGDVYSLSIISQLYYKATGCLLWRIPQLDQGNFDARIGYDVGIYKLDNNKRSYIIGAAYLINKDGIIKFAPAPKTRINKPTYYEDIPKDFVRDLIEGPIKSWINKHRGTIKKGILIQRDGLTKQNEWEGCKLAIDNLIIDGIIDSSAQWAYCSIIKSRPIRMFTTDQIGQPHRGTFVEINPSTSIISTTGYPDIMPSERNKSVGTSKVLEIRKLNSKTPNIPIMEEISKDIYHRTFYRFSSFNPVRLPIELMLVHDALSLRKAGVLKLPKYLMS